MLPKRVAVIAAAVMLMLTAGTTTWADAGQLGPELAARKPVPKTKTEDLRIPTDATGRVVIKFLDEQKARPLPAGNVISLSNRPVDEINTILDRYGFRLTSATGKSQEKLAALEQRAALASGKAQPDLAGMMIAEGPRKHLLAFAQDMNDAATEWVYIEAKLYSSGVGACCFDTGECQIMSAAACAGAGGVFIAGGTCNPNPCGQPLEGCCFGVACIMLTAVDCVTQGGTVLVGVDCAATPGACTPAVCCLGEDDCQILTETECNVQGGSYDSTLTDCEDAECDNDCGAGGTGNCWAVDGNGTAFCDDEICCNLICDIDAFCCDEDNGGFWDEFCAAQANQYCQPHTANWDAMTEMPVNDPPTGPDRCANPLAGSCFELHLNGGCNNQVCCNTVCAMADFCCTGIWGGLCVTMAYQNCTDPQPPAGATPDYTPIQGYKTAAGYAALGGIPAELMPYVPMVAGNPLRGFGGEGLALTGVGEPHSDDGYDGVPGTGDVGENNLWRDPDEPFFDYGADGLPETGDAGELDGVYTLGEPYTELNGDGVWTAGETFTDNNGNLVWDAPGGLWGVAEGLLRAGGDGLPATAEDNADATGMGNLTLGKDTKVAIIEWAYWSHHEDLIVNLEPNQQMIQDEIITNPDHGTACLSIVNARDNGIGMTGIVPEADAYFFPLASVNDGPRELAAWTSAVDTLGAGDVISASYGPGPPIGCINNTQPTWTMIRLASDIGIITCMAAGNDCYNLDGAEDLGDSGGFVIGACTPGAPFYRLTFSNYCTAPDAARSNIVHVKSWGELVAAAGTGVLPYPDGNKNRAYTPIFNGTSAASPIAAGAIAALQGLAKQLYNIPLTPVQMRAALGAPGTPGQPARLFGSFPGPFCNFDIEADQDVNWIGVYPDLAGTFGSASSAIINQTATGFDESPLITDMVWVRGENTSGNHYSLKASDNGYARAEGQYTDRSFQPGSDRISGIGGGSNPSLTIPEIQSLRYLATGYMTDLVAVAQSDIDVVNSMAISVEARWPNVFSVMMIEAYDWRAGRWSYIDIFSDPSQGAQAEDDPDVTFDAETSGPDRFARASDGRMLIRIWTIGFPAVGGFAGGGDTGFSTRFDFLGLTVSDEFGEEIP